VGMLQGKDSVTCRDRVCDGRRDGCDVLCRDGDGRRSRGKRWWWLGVGDELFGGGIGRILGLAGVVLLVDLGAFVGLLARRMRVGVKVVCSLKRLS
jgi:hypothetical protein